MTCMYPMYLICKYAPLRTTTASATAPLGGRQLMRTTYSTPDRTGPDWTRRWVRPAIKLEGLCVSNQVTPQHRSLETVVVIVGVVIVVVFRMNDSYSPRGLYPIANDCPPPEFHKYPARQKNKQKKQSRLMVD